LKLKRNSDTELSNTFTSVDAKPFPLIGLDRIRQQMNEDARDDRRRHYSAVAQCYSARQMSAAVDVRSGAMRIRSGAPYGYYRALNRVQQALSAKGMAFRALEPLKIELLSLVARCVDYRHQPKYDAPHGF
jgi:hypothetical protein